MDVAIEASAVVEYITSVFREPFVSWVYQLISVLILSDIMSSHIVSSVFWILTNKRNTHLSRCEDLRRNIFLKSICGSRRMEGGN